MSLYEAGTSTIMKVMLYTDKVMAPTGDVVVEANLVSGKFTFFNSFSLLPIFFRAFRKRTYVLLSECINTHFTSYLLIFLVIARVSSCGLLTCSISALRRRQLFLPLP